MEENRINMYSKEIKRLLETKNNLINIKEYIKIIESPQIDHIKYDNDLFKLWTNDNYYFELKVVSK